MGLMSLLESEGETEDEGAVVEVSDTENNRKCDTGIGLCFDDY